MAWYLKTTAIVGYDTTDAGPPTGIERMQWGEKHGRIFHLRGHWKPDRALAYARRHRILSDVLITHTTADLNGKGQGGIDARWVATSDGDLTKVDVSEEENDAWSAQSDDDVHHLSG
jgi:hypothetical protein